MRSKQFNMVPAPVNNMQKGAPKSAGRGVNGESVSSTKPSVKYNYQVRKPYSK